MIISLEAKLENSYLTPHMPITDTGLSLGAHD